MIHRLFSSLVRELFLRNPDYDPYEIVKLYAWRKDEPRLGPIDYRYSVPGYRNALGELWLLPVRGGDIPEQEILVEQSASGFGPLDIEVRGLPAAPRPLHTAEDPMLFLHARNLDDGCEYTVRLPSSGHTSLSGLIPTGRTEFALGEQGEPIATLDVSTKSNVVIVDLSDRGGVRVSLACTDGDPCRGPARFEVRSRKHSIVGSAFFHRAPYALYGLAEGEYSLTVHQPYGRTDSHAHTLPFRVIPGQVVETACLPFDGKEPWEDP